MRHWTPPGGGYHGTLNHVVIHGLDVTVPLGVPRRCPDETIRMVLDDLVGGGHAHFGTQIEGRELQASDLDWSHGSGAVLRGEARPRTWRWRSAGARSRTADSRVSRWQGPDAKDRVWRKCLRRRQAGY
jgi:hypothetical protein